MPRLIVVRDQRVETQVDIGADGLRIGRDPSNDVVLADPERWVSRFHAELRHGPSGYVIVDLNTSNGIEVGGERVKEAPLATGTKVVIGPYVLELADAAGADPNPATIFAPPPRAPGRARVPPVQPASVRRPRRRWTKTRQQAVVFGATVVLVGLTGAVAALRTGRSHPPKESERPAVVAFPPAPADDDAQALVDECRAAIQSADFGRARRLLDRIERIWPEHPELSGLRAAIPGPAAPVPPPQPESPRPPAWQDRAIPRSAGEDIASWRERTVRIQASYRAGRSALTAEDPVSARSWFRTVHQDQPSGYLDSMDLSQRAQAAIEQRAAGLLRQARTVEAWAHVDDLLGRIQALAPTAIDVAASRAEILRAHGVLAEWDLRKAIQEHATGSIAVATQLYTRVRDSLPSDHPMAQDAARRLAQIDAGPPR
jgi:hypothetical protein